MFCKWKAENNNFIKEKWENREENNNFIKEKWENREENNTKIWFHSIQIFGFILIQCNISFYTNKLKVLGKGVRDLLFGAFELSIIWITSPILNRKLLSTSNPCTKIRTFHTSNIKWQFCMNQIEGDYFTELKKLEYFLLLLEDIENISGMIIYI